MPKVSVLSASAHSFAAFWLVAGVLLYGLGALVPDPLEAALGGPGFVRIAPVFGIVGAMILLVGELVPTLSFGNGRMRVYLTTYRSRDVEWITLRRRGVHPWLDPRGERADARPRYVVGVKPYGQDRAVHFSVTPPIEADAAFVKALAAACPDRFEDLRGQGAVALSEPQAAILWLRDALIPTYGLLLTALAVGNL